MKILPKPFAIVCLAWLIPMALRAAVTFTDGTFITTDWSAAQTVGNGSLANSQTVAGGNPGTFRRVEHNTFSGQFVGFHYRTAASYDPSSGAIGFIDFSIDQIAIVNHAGIGVGVIPALRQNGIDYLPNFTIPATGF